MAAWSQISLVKIDDLGSSRSNSKRSEISRMMPLLESHRGWRAHQKTCFRYRYFAPAIYYSCEKSLLRSLIRSTDVNNVLLSYFSLAFEGLIVRVAQPWASLRNPFSIYSEDNWFILPRSVCHLPKSRHGHWNVKHTVHDRNDAELANDLIHLLRGKSHDPMSLPSVESVWLMTECALWTFFNVQNNKGF